MATEFQVTFDSADPAVHAAFWAEAVHYVAAPPPAASTRGAPRSTAGPCRPSTVTTARRSSTPTALEGECTRLVALGARRVRRLEADGINAVCIVIQDPEGNEFCLD
jgi:hypothetical protein